MPASQYALVLRQESVEKGVESQFCVVLSDIEKQLCVGRGYFNDVYVLDHKVLNNEVYKAWDFGIFLAEF